MGDRILARTHVSLSHENAESLRESVSGGQVLILKLLIVLTLANATPVILKKIMGLPDGKRCKLMNSHVSNPDAKLTCLSLAP